MTSTNDLIKSYTFKKNRPYPHQVRALQKALDLDKSIALFMEPGTGKTRVAIDFAGIKHLQHGMDKVLIVCPKVAMSVWEDEIQSYLPTAIQRQIVTLDNTVGTKKDRIELVKRYLKVDKLTFIIVNYDVMADQSRMSDEGRITTYKGLKDVLRKFKPQLIILDESHYIKKGSSARSRAIHSFKATPRWKMILSGTPSTNSPLDLFSQYKFLDPDVLGTVWKSFKDRYAIYGGYGGFQLKGYKNLKVLQSKVASIAFQATKDEMDLPDKLPPQVIKVTLSDKTKKVYNEMNDTLIAELKDLGKKATAPIILTKILRLRQITGGFVRVTNEDGTKEDVPVGREKLEALEDLLYSHCKDGGYKVVIFAVFKWEVKQIKLLCDKMKIKAIKDEGIKSDRVRFRDDPSIKVYIIPLAKGGIAVNELVAAHIGIFYSMDHSADHIIQAMDRLHRPGQSKNVLYQFLIARGTIDMDIFRAFIQNKNILDEIIYNIRRLI